MSNIQKYAICNTDFRKNELLGYDVTEKNNPQEIVFSDDYDGFIQCESYDYLLTWREFIQGVAEGWLELV